MKTTPGRASRQRRSAGKSRNKRVIAVVATLVAFGGIVAVTQVSNAGENRRRGGQAPPPCPPATAPATPAADASPSAAAGSSPNAAAGNPNAAGTPNPADPNASYRDRGAIQHPGDGQVPADETRRRGGRNNDGQNCTPSGNTNSSAPANPGNGNNNGNNGLETLGDDCSGSGLQAHGGFQDGNRCVSTAFGEVAAAENNPTLVIADAPRSVRVNQQFTITVSTRNLVRDRFLGAAAGGYYLESSFLTENGLTRGHFHTACRMLTGNRRNAPDPAPVPAFFVATEDGRGGNQPDQVTVTIPGLPQRGTAQCASWAGDGSHRVPMMQRANQIPAFDVVRIQVR